MEFKWIEGEGAGFEDARRVRLAVFVAEQGYSASGEFDALDAASRHVVGYEDGQPVLTARLFPGQDGALHIGRVAVVAARRGGGRGLAAIKEMERRAREAGAAALVLDAQADKAGFYEKAGYAKTGRTLLDEGVPHVEMRLEL